MPIMLSPEKLRRFPLFAGITEAMLKAFAKAGQEIALKRGAWLFREGDEADAFYLILSGAIELKINLDPERLYQADLATLIEGDMLGWSALVEPYIYQMGAVAIKDSRLAKFDGPTICELMTHNPATGYVLMCRLAAVVGSRLSALRIRFASLVEGNRWQSASRRPSEEANVN